MNCDRATELRERLREALVDEEPPCECPAPGDPHYGCDCGNSAYQASTLGRNALRAEIRALLGETDGE